MPREVLVWRNGRVVPVDKLPPRIDRRRDVNAGEYLPGRVERIEDKARFEENRVKSGGSEVCRGGKFRWVPGKGVVEEKVVLVKKGKSVGQTENPNIITDLSKYNIKGEK